MKGIKSKTPLYQAIYILLGIFYPLLKKLPKYVTNTVTLGQAMIRVGAGGYEKKVLESIDINKLAVSSGC